MFERLGGGQSQSDQHKEPDMYIGLGTAIIILIILLIIFL